MDCWGVGLIGVFGGVVGGWKIFDTYNDRFVVCWIALGIDEACLADVVGTSARRRGE